MTGHALARFLRPDVPRHPPLAWVALPRVATWQPATANNSVVGNLFNVGLSLQAAIDVPDDVAAQHVTEAISRLERHDPRDLVRGVRRPDQADLTPPPQANRPQPTIAAPRRRNGRGATNSHAGSFPQAQGIRHRARRCGQEGMQCKSADGLGRRLAPGDTRRSEQTSARQTGESRLRGRVAGPWTADEFDAGAVQAGEVPSAVLDVDGQV